MIRRLPVAIVVGCGIGLALLWVMQALIGVEGELGKKSSPFSIDFVRLRRDTAPEPEKRQPPRKTKPEAPPPPPQMSMKKARLDNAETVAAIAPEISSHETSSSLIGGGGADRDVVPLVRIEPDYPAAAAQRGIEGWVVVKFTVTKIGSVADAAVVKSYPSGIFDRAALAAVRRWKYNPKIENGQAVARPGVLQRIDFDMEH